MRVEGRKESRISEHTSLELCSRMKRYEKGSHMIQTCLLYIQHLCV